MSIKAADLQPGDQLTFTAPDGSTFRLTVVGWGLRKWPLVDVGGAVCPVVPDMDGYLADSFARAEEVTD